MATRSTVPDEVERGDKLIESREPMIISLILDVLTCISLLAVQVSTEVKYDDILLAEPVDGISSDSACGIVYKFMQFASSSEIINKDYK